MEKDFVTKEEIKAAQDKDAIWRDALIDSLRQRNEDYLMDLLYGAIDGGSEKRSKRFY